MELLSKVTVEVAAAAEVGAVVEVEVMVATVVDMVAADMVAADTAVAVAGMEEAEVAEEAVPEAAVGAVISVESLVTLPETARIVGAALVAAAVAQAAAAVISVVTLVTLPETALTVKVRVFRKQPRFTLSSCSSSAF